MYRPNTRILVDEFTDEHLQRIMGIYRSIGFLCDPDPIKGMTAEQYRRTQNLELRPASMLSSHVTIQAAHCSADDGMYVHVVMNLDKVPIYHQVDADTLDNAEKVFNEAIWREFVAKTSE